MSYVWDDFGNVVSTQLPNHSLPTLYDYNAQGLLTRKLIEPSTSIAGRVLLDWAYDQLGRPVQSRENGTEVLSWQYDGNTVNQPPNCQTLLTSDYQAGRLTVASDPVWHTWYSYDADGQVVQEARTSRAFDSGGDCVTGEGMGIPLSTNPVISTTYTVNGAPLTLTYPTGRAVRIVRDHTHRPTSLAITYDSDPEPTHEIELETIRNISWWPGGQLRSYEVAARENLTAPASWSKISFRLGSGSSVATSALGTSCPSTEVDGTGVGDSSARLRAIYVTRGGQNVARFLYRWKGEQITESARCYLSASSAHVEHMDDGSALTYDRMGQLRGVNNVNASSSYGFGLARRYDLDSRGNRTTEWVTNQAPRVGTAYSYLPANPDQLSSAVYSHESLGVDPVLWYARAANGSVTVPVRSGRNRSYQHDAIGRVSEVAGPFGFIRPFDPNNAPTMPSGSETVLRTTETRAGIFSYYYDSQNRRTRKEYPTGDMDEFVWGPGRELLMETAPFKLGIGPDGAHSVDEYVHLGGRPVLTLRRLYNAKDGRTRWRPEFRDFDGASQCARHDEPGRCEPHAIITDVIGKPVLTLDTVGRISGVMEYDPGGLVNRATYWDDMSNTPHEWCWWVGYGMKVATGGLAPLQSQLRTRMPRVAQSTNSCVGQFKLSAAGVWSQEPNNHWECGPKSHTVMPWVSMADNDLVALKYCSWDGAPVNPQPLGISVEGFEYRKFEAGATPYLVPLRYPGQYFDEETEFHENWNRYYDPSTGRYLSPEPLLQSPNWVTSELSQGHQVPAYAYARNNPMMNVDPTGLFVDWDVRDGDVAVALLDIGMDPVLGPMMRRLWADTRNGVNLRRAQPLSLKERGGGFTSYPRKNFRGGDTCDSNFDPEGHHEFVKGLGPLALSEDEVRALIAHELGHAYYSLYGGDADRGSIDWENRMRLGPQRSYWRNSTDRTGFHGWPR